MKLLIVHCSATSCYCAHKFWREIPHVSNKKYLNSCLTSHLYMISLPIPELLCTRMCAILEFLDRFAPLTIQIQYSRQHVNRMPRSRLQNLLTKYVARGIINQGRRLKGPLHEWDRDRPKITYFPESEMIMIQHSKTSMTNLRIICIIWSILWLHNGMEGPNTRVERWICLLYINEQRRGIWCHKRQTIETEFCAIKLVMQLKPFNFKSGLLFQMFFFRNASVKLSELDKDSWFLRMRNKNNFYT
jgi:hypothetical protein